MLQIKEKMFIRHLSGIGIESILCINFVYRNGSSSQFSYKICGPYEILSGHKICKTTITTKKELTDPHIHIPYKVFKMFNKTYFYGN